MRKFWLGIVMVLGVMLPGIATAGVEGFARISLVQGEVQVRDEESDDWLPAGVNTPLEEGDSIWSPAGSRVEIQFRNGTYLRLEGRTIVDMVDIEHDQQRGSAVCRRERRVPKRPGCRDDDQGGQSQSQQREPPRRARRGFFFRGDLEQQARRRKIDAAGARRNQPQQPPQHGQTEQAKQHQRLRKPKRYRSDHAALTGLAVACLVLATNGCVLSPMRECSTSRSSLAGRSVRWTAKLHPRRSVSARIAAR